MDKEEAGIGISGYENRQIALSTPIHVRERRFGVVAGLFCRKEHPTGFHALGHVGVCLVPISQK